MVFSMDNNCVTCCMVLPFLMIISQPLLDIVILDSKQLLYGIIILDNNHTTIALYPIEVLDTHKMLEPTPIPLNIPCVPFTF